MMTVLLALYFIGMLPYFIWHMGGTYAYFARKYRIIWYPYKNSWFAIFISLFTMFVWPAFAILSYFVNFEMMKYGWRLPYTNVDKNADGSDYLYDREDFNRYFDMADYYEKKLGIKYKN